MADSGGNILKVIFDGVKTLATDPLSVVDPTDGQFAIGAIFDPQRRETFKTIRELQPQLAKLEAQSKAVELYKGFSDLFAQAPTQEAAWQLSNQLGGSSNPNPKYSTGEAKVGDPMVDAARRARNQQLKLGRKAAATLPAEAGVTPEIARIMSPEDIVQVAQQGTQAAFTRGTNEQQGRITRENQKNQADLARETDRLRQERTFTNQTEIERYKATLDVWKKAQDQGKAEADPYPVLEGLYHSGAFRENKNLEQIVGYHVANRTDPATASRLLTDIQTTVAKPEAAKKPSLTERRDAQAIKNLKMTLRAGEIPEEQRGAARRSIRSGDAGTARGLLQQRIAAKKPPTGDDWLPSAKALIDDPKRFATLPAEQQSIIQQAVQTNDRAALKIVMPAILKGDMEGADKVFKDPMFRSIVQQSQELVNAKSKADFALESARLPGGEVGKVDPDLFGPLLSRIDPQLQMLMPGYDDDWKNRKQATVSAATDSLSAFILSRSGKAASDTERRMLTGAWINGNEPSASNFIAKYNAIQRAMDREIELREQEARLLAAGLSAGSIEQGLDALFSSTLETKYRENAMQLARELEAASTDPETMPTGDLTDQEKAVLAEIQGGR